MADPGSLLMQGLTNAGNGLAQGQANYQQYLQQDAAATGTVNAYLNQDPTGSGLSPDGQALIQKQLAGNANRKDRLQLLGEINSAQTLKANQQEQQMNAYKIQEQKMRMAAIQQMLAQGQGGGAPGGAPAGTPQPGGGQPPQGQPQQPQGQPAQGQPQQPPAPPPLFKQPLVSMTDPAMVAMRQKLAGQALQTNGFDLKDAGDKATAAAQSAVDAQNSMEQPVGFQAAGFDPATRQDIWQPLVGKRGGTIIAKGAPVKVVGKPPGPVLIQNDNGDYVPAAQQMHADAAAASGEMAPDADQIIPSKEQQALIADANTKADTAGTTQNLANQTYAAAQAYTSGNTGALNSLKGSQFGQHLLAAFGRGDAQTLDTLSQQMMVPQVQQLKGQGSLRVGELPFLAAPLASPEKGNALIMDMADMNRQKAQFLSQRAGAYQQAVKNGWGEGTAGEKAIDKVPMPKMFLLSQRNRAAAVPSSAQTYLKQHPDTAALFDQRYGGGTAAVILGQ